MYTHSASSVGTHLTYSHEGQLSQSSPKARDKGTTVHVTDLFKPLAVRYKTFKRGLKREYTKMITVVQSYALVCCHVRFSLSNQNNKNKQRTVVFSTQASNTIANVITNIYGSKQLVCMCVCVCVCVCVYVCMYVCVCVYVCVCC